MSEEKKSEELLITACRKGNIEEARNLLQNPLINPNCLSQDQFVATPFYFACKNGHIEVMKLLLNEDRVDINKPSIHGVTPFYSTCYNGHVDVVTLLLNDKRVDVNKAQDEGETPFGIACKNGKFEVVKLLLNDKRVDMNKADTKGWTPFYLACLNGNIEVVKLLLNDERADLNKPSKYYNQTPFYITCDNGHIEGQLEIVKYILASEREVNVNAKDEEGKTAIDIARERRKEDKGKWESEEDFKKRTQRLDNIIELLGSFEKNSKETRAKLRKELGLSGN